MLKVNACNSRCVISEAAIETFDASLRRPALNSHVGGL